MSWDNVSDIKNIKIWTDYSDSTQGHLFVNDNHQLKLNVGISFTLKTGETEGPTDDEVYSALSLIDNQDSGPLKYFTIVDENIYTTVYDPYHVQADNGTSPDTIDDGIYDFVFTYYVTSPLSINAEAYSESVALQLDYTITDSEGNTTEVVKQTSANGNYYTKTYVSVICYPPKLYGNTDENRTSINYASKDVPESDRWENDYNFEHQGNNFGITWFYIDDPYFKFFSFDGCAEPVHGEIYNPFYIYVENAKPRYDYVYNSFFPAIKCGEFTYSLMIAIRSYPDTSYKEIFTENITVHQEENQITFLTAHTTGENLDYTGYESNRIRIEAYDQFGNSMSIVAWANGADAFPLSVS